MLWVFKATFYNISYYWKKPVYKVKIYSFGLREVMKTRDFFLESLCLPCKNQILNIDYFFN